MNKEKFGFNINLKMTPEDIRKLGDTVLKQGLYEAIEVTYYENMEHVDTTEYNEAIMEIISKYNPQVLVHISAFNLAEENSTLRNAIMKEIQNCIAYTKKLGGKEIIIHSGFIGYGLHVPIVRPDGGIITDKDVMKKGWDLSVEMMRKACDWAKDENMTLYTENLNGSQLTVTSQELLAYLKDVGRDNLKLVFDVGHCYHMGKNVYSEVVEAGNFLGHLHIHDNHGQKKKGHQDEHLPLGEGTLEVLEFVKGLKQVNYNGLYMMEISLCTEENLVSSRNLLKEINEKS